jgi:serine/threonine-protein kinase
VVAIKTVNLAGDFEESQIQEAKERFFREAKAAGRLNHPHIVTIFDMGEEDDLAYIAMDYLDGVNLATYANPERLLDVAEVLDIGAQVADSLDYAHKQNVVHRDIKPANIIYDKNKHSAVVTDFGIASLTDSTQTKTGIILGTPSYMSPEQIAGKKIDGRSDLFSLGVTLYQLISGVLPFEGDSMAALMFKITNEKHASIRRVRSDLPACVGTIMNKALQKDAEARYATGADMAKDLRKCLAKIEG